MKKLYVIIMNSVRDWSIKTKFIAAVVCLLFLAITALSLFFINKVENLLISNLEDKVRLLNKNFSIVVENALRENSFSFLQQLTVEVAEKDRELVALVVANSKNMVIASSNTDEHPLFSVIDSENIQSVLKNEKMSANESIWRYFKKKRMESVRLIRGNIAPSNPVNDSEKKEQGRLTESPQKNPVSGELVGFIYLSLTTEYLEQEVRSFWIFSGVFILIFLLIASGGAYSLGVRMTRPIKNLADKVTIYASGNLSEPITSLGRDEIGSLIQNVDQMRSSLKDMTENLEKKVEERTRQLEATNRELEAFSYSVSHDLRAPLRSIDGFSQAILEDYYNAVDDTGKDFLTRIRKASQRMGELIDDILKLSRLARSEMIREDFNISELAQEVYSVIREKDAVRKAEFISEKNLMASGDKRLVKILLENLLGNAWKYSSKKEETRIEFSSVTGSEGTYFVKDNGAGFKMTQTTKLFTPFQRLHTAQEFEGTGIGLATVQRIINKHGGKIRAEAEVDKGATFYFTLG